MFTFAVLIGAMAVPATFQLTVPCPDQETPLVGAVTRNGPAEATTVTWESPLSTPPAPARLSRAVTRKFMVRLVDGNRSPAVVVLFTMSDSWGNVRLGFVVGAN